MTRLGPEDVRRLVAQLNLHDALSTVTIRGAQLSQARVFERGFGTAHLTAWTLAYLAKEILRSSDPCAIRPLGDTELEWILNAYVDFPEPIEFENPASSPHENWRALIRLANSQYPYQEPIFDAIARTAILLCDVPQKPFRGKTIDIKGEIREIYGLSVEDVIRIGVILAAAVQAKTAPISSISRMASSQLPGFTDILQPEKIRLFCRALGSTIDELRQEIGRETVRPHFEKYTFNQLRATPLILIDDDRFHVPVPQFLAEAIAAGLYHSLSRNSPQQEKGNTFREKFGDIFEAYVGLQIQSSLPNWKASYQSFGEIRFGKGKSRLSPDWILVREEEAVLIECKTSQLTLAAKTYAKGREFEKDAQRLFVSSVRQIADFIAFVKKNPNNISELRGVKRFYGLVVCYAPLFLANSAFRNIYAGSLPPLTSEFRDCQFLNIMEFERLLGLAEGVDLLELLEEKACNPRQSEMEFDTFMKTGYASPPFNPLLRAKISELFYLTA